LKRSSGVLGGALTGVALRVALAGVALAGVALSVALTGVALAGGSPRDAAVVFTSEISPRRAAGE
jgi:hypothetical protein